MLQQVVPRQENYSQGRALALHNVESTISELGGIFTHLASMVAHQGEIAIRFEIYVLVFSFSFIFKGRVKERELLQF